MADKDWRVTLEFVEQASGRVFDTTFCIRDHTSEPLADALSAATVASDMASWLTVTARAMTPSVVTLTRALVNRGGVWGPGEGDDPEAGEAAINSAGTLPDSGTHILEHGICARVTIRTNLASRRGRGRFHAPWPKWADWKSDSAPDLWSTGGAYFVNVTSFANLLLAGHDVTHDLVSHHYSLRVHSRKDAVTRDAVAVVPRSQVSYLRSRLTAP